MKLNKYNNFLLESAFYDLLLESKLAYKKSFTTILNELKNDSDVFVRKIANFLLLIIKSDKDLKLIQNYIDADLDPSKVSFIPDNKVSTENTEIRLKDNDNQLSNIVGDHSILDSCRISRLNLRHPNVLSDLPSNRWRLIGGPYDGGQHGSAFDIYTLYLLQNIDDPTYKVACFDNSSNGSKGFEQVIDLPEDLRGNIKIGRFINRIMDIWFKEYPLDLDSIDGRIIGKREDYTSTHVERFVNAYSAIILFKNNAMDFFEVVKGDDIKYWYLEDRYESLTGQLGSSCMRYKSCQDYFNIYTENPEVCQLLIFKNKSRDKINGRALLWTDVDGKKWIDRIYTVKDSYKELFIKWVDENDYKELYGFDRQVQVEVKNKDYGKYPYMDSLSQFKMFDDDEPALLSTRFVDFERPYYSLQETNGRHYEA
jgi:hypothetical protein